MDTTWMTLKGIKLSEKTNPQRLQTVWLIYITFLTGQHCRNGGQMNDCQWQETGGTGEGVEAKGATGWILVMMELFCILTVVVDI